MLPEINRIQYPFVPVDNPTSTELQFMQNIKCMQIWVHTTKAVRAAVIAFSPSMITIRLEQSDSGEAVNVFCTSTGNFAQSDKIDAKNSFAVYARPITATATCHLQLLPEVICQIPQGLTLYTKSHKIKSVAVYSDSDSAEQWPYEDINFLSGYNFEPSIAGTGIVLAAGAGIGKGSPKASQVRNKINSYRQNPPEQHSDSYYQGLRTINGLTNDVSIQVSNGMYLQTTTSGTITTLEIKQKEGA